MSKIVILSHTPRHSGFGRVAERIANALCSQHHVKVIGLGFAEPDDLWEGSPLNSQDVGHTSALRASIKVDSPDILIIIGVNTLSAWQAERVRIDGHRFIVIAYVPVEGTIFDPVRLKGLKHCDKIVAYHASGARELAKALMSPSVIWINHGVDFGVDRPQKFTTKEARQILFPQLYNYHNMVWVLNANRNDGRKRPEVTMRAFSDAYQHNQDLLLLMHCNPARSTFNLKAERDRLGLGSNVIFTHDCIGTKLTELQMACLYSCCQIGVNSASGEGWGLIPFEHALHGGAQILPRHEGLQEIWGESPCWVKTGETHVIDKVSLGLEVDQKELCSAILKLSGDKIYRGKIAKKCNDVAQNKMLSWSEIGKQWLYLMESFQ